MTIDWERPPGVGLRLVLIIFHRDQSYAGVNIIDDYYDDSVVPVMNGSC